MVLTLKVSDGIFSQAVLQYKFTGVSNEIPLIGLEKTQKINCLDAQYPADSYVKVQKSITKDNIKVILHRLRSNVRHNITAC